VRGQKVGAYYYIIHTYRPAPTSSDSCNKNHILCM